MKVLKLFLVGAFLLFFSLGYAQIGEDPEEEFDFSDNDTIEVNIVPSGCAKIDAIVNLALTKRHCRYKYGSAGPNTFDCSGLVYFSFKSNGITLTRSSKDQYHFGKKVSTADIMKGDLVFFKRGKTVGHVGLVIETLPDGAYKFIHASNAKNGIRIDVSTRPGYFNTFVGAKRIIDCENDSLFAATPLDSLDLLELGYIPGQSSVSQTSSGQTTTNTQNGNSSSGKTIYYTVKQGDTLYAISKKYGTTVDKLKSWNKLPSDRLQIGQKLKIVR
jgi:hypothetical protein